MRNLLGGIRQFLGLSAILYMATAINFMAINHTRLRSSMAWVPTVSVLYGHNVKNRFSNLTKEQVGRDWQRKDITNDCQGKALKEGSHEREWIG